MLCSLRRKLVRNRRGQALVELALLIPVLLVLLLGVFEFGRLFNAYMTVQHAAREGCRIGVLGATDAEIVAVVESNAVTLNPAELTISISPALASRTSGTIMTVTVNYNFRVLVPVISALLGSGLPIRSALSMRVE